MDSTLSTFTASDGENIAVQNWPLESGRRLRAMVILVHGLGEYAGRYSALAERLNGWGFSVRGYDQYGHGESDGVRGGLPTESRLLDDLGDIVQSTRARLPANVPIILLGHSLGGLVAARWLAQQSPPPAAMALVLSSPALAPRLNLVQHMMVTVLSRVAPRLQLRSRLDPRRLAKAADVVRAYQDDPLVHDRITPRLAHFIRDAARALLAAAPRWTVPTLLLYSGDDGLVDPQGSRSFAAAAPAGVVQAQCFANLRHEIFNETESDAVYQALRLWLDQRC